MGILVRMLISGLKESLGWLGELAALTYLKLTLCSYLDFPDNYPMANLPHCKLASILHKSFSLNGICLIPMPMEVSRLVQQSNNGIILAYIC
jgi:hypothetical protein